MFFIVGLGNPGNDYIHTRHNLGFDVVDKVVDEWKLRWKEGKGEYVFAVGSLKDVEFGLAKPLTYMNNSGDAVADIVGRFEVPLAQLLVVCDDFQLPLGVLRLRPGGSDGGHNGLYSIIYQLQSDQFPRLRCGIGSLTMPTDKNLMAGFVLEQFSKEELPLAKQMVERAREASLSFIEQGIDRTMNMFNQTTLNSKK
ncbi:MAG: aminoacyl-tRNA hydrolase [Ignavibacteriales bacterium]|nr:aminoacyl-tRNA hydrolase [Ignavibacteriales bacterium]